MDLDQDGSLPTSQELAATTSDRLHQGGLLVQMLALSLRDLDATDSCVLDGAQLASLSDMANNNSYDGMNVDTDSGIDVHSNDCDWADSTADHNLGGG